MTLRDAMRVGLRKPVEAFGETWSYRVQTSAPGAAPITWSGWTTFTAHVAARGIVNEQSGDTRTTSRHERAVIRTSDLVVLGEFHQVKDPNDVAFAVGGAIGEAIVVSAGPGTVAYRINRPINGLVGEHRGGGG